MLKVRVLNTMKLFTRGVASHFDLKFENFLCLPKKTHYSDTFAAISAGIFLSVVLLVILGSYSSRNTVEFYIHISFNLAFSQLIKPQLSKFFFFSADEKCSALVIPKLNKMRHKPVFRNQVTQTICRICLFVEEYFCRTSRKIAFTK